MSSPIETAFKAVGQAVDTTTLYAGIMSQMQALFSAVRNSEGFTQKHLCDVGIYLSEEYGELCESETRDLDAEFDKLRERLGFK